MRKFSSKIRNLKDIELCDISKTHTRLLLQHLKNLRACIRPDLEWLGFNMEEAYICYDALKAELAKREHIPNKSEAKKIRQQKAKEKKNR